MAIEGIEKSLEVVITISLEALMKDNPISFYELNEVCKDPNHKMFGNSQEAMDELGLLEASGKPHKSVCQVLSAHTRGEGLDLEFFR
jgi:hypothetical protein